MITISFNKSRSKQYSDAVKLSGTFENNYKEGDVTNVVVLIKEVFEKFEDFASLFWMVLEWKGTTITYDRMTYHSRTDKTKIFYALQDAHNQWMNTTTYKLRNLFKVHEGKITLKNLNTEMLTEEQANLLIDAYLYLHAKQ